MNWRRYCIWLAAVWVAFAPIQAAANIGLPMIAVFLPPLWVALIPIILVESAIVAKGARVPFGTSVGAVALANVVSTIVGVPVLWFLLATIELLCCGGALGLGSAWAKLYAVTVQAPWLIPYESDFGWMIPAALVTLAIVFAVMSVLVETPIVARVTKTERRRMWGSMWIANVVSYALLGLAGLFVATSSVKLDSLQRLFMPLSEVMVETVFLVARSLVKGSP